MLECWFEVCTRDYAMPRLAASLRTRFAIYFGIANHTTDCECNASHESYFSRAACDALHTSHTPHHALHSSRAPLLLLASAAAKLIRASAAPLKCAISGFASGSFCMINQWAGLYALQRRGAANRVSERTTSLLWTTSLLSSAHPLLPRGFY